MSLPLSTQQWQLLPKTQNLAKYLANIKIQLTDEISTKQWKGTFNRFEQHLDSKSRQRAIIAKVLYPISGMMMSGAGGHGLSVFGFELLAQNVDPISGKKVVLNETIASIGHNLHGKLVWIVIGIIVLHAVGALKHHFIDKDETIRRMFTFKK